MRNSHIEKMVLDKDNPAYKLMQEHNRLYDEICNQNLEKTFYKTTQKVVPETFAKEIEKEIINAIRK